jgi:hypothetical protein
LGEGLVLEPADLLGASGCPVAGAGADKPDVPLFRFGRMFEKSSVDRKSKEFQDLLAALVALGQCMNEPQKFGHQPLPPTPSESNIPAGYTYLGQFIAHEVTFDSTKKLPEVEPNPQNLRSPCIDLDSIYGAGPGDESSKRYYFELDPAFLMTGSTQSFFGFVSQNDLPRDGCGVAVIPDERNDENLAVAQTQVALIKFHNKVVRKLRAEGHNSADLFDCARMQVVRHFQWIILYDFLPMLVNKDVLASVMADGPQRFTPDDNTVYMPLEFSAAAFRLGHSMVRSEYLWNKFHAAQEPGSFSPATLIDLFDQTAFSGGIGKSDASRALPGDWLIDWRRFFKFDPPQIEPAHSNMAAKIDTNFDLHLTKNFPAPGIVEGKKPLMVRNLLRGLALSLPSGERVAAEMCQAKLLKEADVLTQAEISAGAQQDILNAAPLLGNTPLWYYILREAELKGKGNQLGPIGSRIVAETLFGLIKCSPNSILKSPQWRPRFTTRHDSNGTPIFEMTDLLTFAGVVNPYKV